MNEPNEVIRSSRKVIEKKLLLALQEEGNVAVIFSADDLEVVALALEWRDTPVARELAAGFRQLQREAFPK